MKKQRIMSLLLSLAMMFSLLPANAMAAKTEDFTDISKDDWYYKYVDYVVDKGYFSGTSDTTFSPGMPMTRAMFVVVLTALEGIKVDNNVSPFADVPANTWYSGAVKWASDKKIVSGTGDNKFAPDTIVSREEMAVMMNAYVEWHAKTFNKTHKVKAQVEGFKDASSVSSWASEGVEACHKWGLIAGTPDGNFNPKNTASRAEVATVIYNLAWMVKESGGNPPPVHNCSFGTDWKYDASYHWHECSCGAKADVAAHTDVTLLDHKCDVCGYLMGTCEDNDNNGHCDICGACLVEDLLYNAISGSIEAVKDKADDVIDDISNLDNAVISAIEDAGLLDMVDINDAYVKVGGDDTFVKVTGLKLDGANACMDYASRNIDIDTVLSLKKDTAKDIIDMHGLTYEMAVDAAKLLVGGVGYAAIVMTEGDAVATANAIADKFEEVTGIPVPQTTIDKAIDILKTAPSNGKDFASDVWNNNFKNAAGYVTGDVTFDVNGTAIVVKVDDANGTYMTGSKTEAVADIALAIAKDLYADVKNSSNGAWITLPDMTLDVTVDVDFAVPTNGNKTAREHFTSCYPVNFTFAFAGDAFDYVEYKYDTVNNVRITVPQKVKDLYTASAKKLVDTVLVPRLSQMIQDMMTGGVSLYRLAAAPAPQAEFSFDLESLIQDSMKDIMDAWLSDNMANGNLSDLIANPESAVLDNSVVVELLDSTMTDTLSSVMDSVLQGIVTPGDEDALILAGDPAELDTLLKDYLDEVKPGAYETLKDNNLVDYTIAKTQEYLDPDFEQNGGVPYTEETKNSAGETVKPAEQMKESVDKVVSDTIVEKFEEALPDPEDEEFKMIQSALDAVTVLTTFESMSEAKLSTLAALLENDAFIDIIDERGGSLVSRVSTLASYIPESASVTVAGMTVDSTHITALAQAENTADACSAMAQILDQLSDLSLSSFNGEGQPITVTVGSKSVTFGLAFKF